jgi:hypothetical protein
MQAKTVVKELQPSESAKRRYKSFLDTQIERHRIGADKEKDNMNEFDEGSYAKTLAAACHQEHLEIMNKHKGQLVRAPLSFAQRRLTLCVSENFARTESCGSCKTASCETC